MSKQEQTGDLSSLLGNLSLKNDNQHINKQSEKLQQEINRAGFRIFECVSDLGYFTWNVPIDATYHNLGSITNIDQLTLSSYLDVNGMPGKLVDLTTIDTPTLFLSLPPHIHMNQFPHGIHAIVCFHVAARYRGLNFDDVDFAFGVSTLHMLAHKNVKKHSYMVSRVPGSKTIMVSQKIDSFTKTLSHLGYQFERLMTGRPMDDTSSNVCTSAGHLQMMNIGSHRVFFGSRTDAILDGSPVEITTTKPCNMRSKFMFQMISCGSTKLCSGFNDDGELLEVAVQSLQQVATAALACSSKRKLTKRESFERNILECMERLQSRMEDTTPGDVFEVSFEDGGLLNLLPVHHGLSTDFLPPTDVVRSLISPTKKE